MKLTLGERLRNLREDDDLTQTELGAKVGITQRKVSYIEQDHIEPNLENIIAICRFFDISADYFLDLPANNTIKLTIDEQIISIFVLVSEISKAETSTTIIIIKTQI